MPNQMQLDEYHFLEGAYGNYEEFETKITNSFPTRENSTSFRILEIGCGSGTTTSIISNFFRNSKLVSIDHDERAVSFCKDRFSASRNINFFTIDAIDFCESQGDHHYDFVVSAFTIHNIINYKREKLYSQLFRILKPGGIFINGDKFVSEEREVRYDALKFRVGKLLDAIDPMPRELAKYWVLHYLEDFKPERRLLFAQTVCDLHKQGFENVKYTFRSDAEMLGIIEAYKPK